MAVLRKTIGGFDSPWVQPLMALLRTQSKQTIVSWVTDYAEQHILPIYERAYPGDARPRTALEQARAWMAGQLHFKLAKAAILDAHRAAREAGDNVAAQAAARAVGQAASAIHAPGHSLAIAFYGPAAIAYDAVGPDKPLGDYELIAAIECAKMEASLREVAVIDEPNPAKINWRNKLAKHVIYAQVTYPY